MKVAVVVVTFNRIECLKKTLSSIESQSFKDFEILVVDNNSSDGTRDWLLKWSEEDAQNKRHVMLLETNSGGAGGFSKGIEWADKNSFEWTWMMDDDVIPMVNCLEKLLSYKEHSECIHPRRTLADGSIYDTWGGFFSRDWLSVDLTISNGNTDYFATSVGCFEGMLISRNIVQKIGYPDSRYFILDDDTIYGYLAAQHTNVICTKEPLMARQLQAPAKQSELSFYHFVRNKFITMDVIESNFGSVSRLRKLMIYTHHLIVSLKKAIPLGLRGMYLATWGIADGILGRFNDEFIRSHRK